MNLQSKNLKKLLISALDILLCIGAYTLWIEKWSYITTTFLLVCCVLCFVFSKKAKSISKHTLLWLIYVICLLLNVMISTDYSESFSFAKVLIAMIITMLVFSMADINPVMIGRVFIITSTILSFSVVWEFIDFNSFQDVAREIFSTDLYIEISKLHGSFNRYVGFGVYSGPSACMIIYGVCAAFAYMKKTALFYAIIAIDIFAVILTGSRTLLILVILVWLIYSLCMKSKEEKKITAKKILLSAGCITAGLVLILNFISENESGLRLVNGTATSASILARFALYGLALKIFTSYPLFGSGVNTFLNYSSITGSTENTYTHNLILQTLAEQGIIGTLLLMTAMIYSFIVIFKLWKKSPDSKALRFSLMIQLVFFVYSMVGNPFYDINLRLVYFIGLYLGLRCKKIVQSATNCDRSMNKIW